MPLPNASVTVADDASGNTIATHSVSGKEYEVVMIADESGHIQQTLPTYSLWAATTAVGASKLFFDLFNASGSGKTLEIRGIWCIPKSDTAVTATLGVEIGLYRTSAVGTGGTTIAYNTGTTLSTSVITPWDTNNAALPAGVTARFLPTGGATIAAPWWGQHIWTEETNPPATAVSAFTNLMPVGTMNQRLTLNENQGFLVKQGTVAGAGNLQFLVLFTLT